LLGATDHAVQDRTRELNFETIYPPSEHGSCRIS